MITFGDAQVTRRTVKTKLHTGQTIALTPADEKMLRSAYDHLQGYAERVSLQQALQLKQEELGQMGVGALLSGFKGANRKAATTVTVIDGARVTTTSAAGAGSEGFDPEAETERVNRAKDEFKVLEERLAVHIAADQRICFRDIDTIMRDLGVPSPQKRVIDQMIWEVDEMADGVICWDEFQLAYYRSINDSTSNEPQAFFRLLEFLTFDQTHKGYIIEDDCMEILFARIGGKNLEKELRSLFGDKLRALGGDGTLSLEGYLLACLAKTGRRALLF